MTSMPTGHQVNEPPAGNLHVICGPMFAGKTTELLRRYHQAIVSLGSAQVIIIKPLADVRSGAEFVRTHSGECAAAIAVKDAQHAADSIGSARAIFLDEAHFFGSELAQIVKSWLVQGKSVTIAGIELDHLGRPFASFPELLCEANCVQKISGVCAKCHGRRGPSIYSQRLFASSQAIVVGGAESYEARCRVCFAPAAVANNMPCEG